MRHGHAAFRFIIVRSFHVSKEDESSKKLVAYWNSLTSPFENSYL